MRIDNCLILTAVLTTVLILFSDTCFSAKFVYVSSSGNDFNTGLDTTTAKKTIQAGVDVCVGGDTLVLLPGIYKESASIPAITLFINGAGDVTIDAESTRDYAFSCGDGMGLLIRGVKFTNVNAATNSTVFKEVGQSISVKSTNCEFTNCSRIIYTYNIHWTGSPLSEFQNCKFINITNTVVELRRFLVYGFTVNGCVFKNCNKILYEWGENSSYDITFTNNLFYSISDTAIKLYGAGMKNPIFLTNNIFYNCGSWIVYADSSNGVTRSYNDFYNNSGVLFYNNGTILDTGTNYMTGKPIFVDESQNNFHPYRTSPVIDLGTGTGHKGGAKDIGPYEYDPPDTITNLQASAGGAGEVQLRWSAPSHWLSGKASSYVVKFSSSLITNESEFDSANTFSQSLTPKSAGTEENITITGLTPATAYYFAVESLSETQDQSLISNVVQATSGGQSEWSPSLQILQTEVDASPGTFKITLLWDKTPVVPTTLKYEIYRSSNLSDWTYDTAVSDTTVTLSGIVWDNPWYFKVRARYVFFSDTQYSGYSNIVADTVPPVWSKNFSVAIGQTFKSDAKTYEAKLSWEESSDSISKQVYYEIDRKTQGEWQLIYRTQTTFYNEELPDATKAVTYRVRATDVSGNRTDWSQEKGVGMKKEASSLISKDFTGTKEIRIDDGDGITENDAMIQIQEASFVRDVVLTMLITDEGPCELKITDADGKALYGIQPKKAFKIRLPYEIMQIKKLGWSEDELGIKYYDGLKWRDIGGDVNKTYRTVTATSYHFSLYKVDARTANTNSINVAPAVFTPNNDGINDIVVFNVVGQADSVKLRICDLNGKEILYKEFSGNTSFGWDGRDLNGSLLETGSYVFVIERDGKRENGIVVLSR